MNTPKTEPASLLQLMGRYQVKEGGKYISQEFQDYAYRLAMALTGGQDDRETIGMCMRLVKTKPRALLEQAERFIADANAKNKTALFLWKVKELEKEAKERGKEKQVAPLALPLE